jgi:spermidine synthase
MTSAVVSAAAPVAAVRAAAIVPYAVTIFLSAFLLFLVQPIIAKQILPWFGGSAGVWTTCLVFFQSTLLAGYAYADLTGKLGVRRQAWLHVTLLLLSLLTLPILASEAWKPQGSEEPIGRILLLLVVTIGLPYFLLSTTTPLLQAWYWRRHRAAVPYRLFALSNFASLLALLGFPVLFEPAFTLPQLGWLWSGVYVAFVAICAATAWASLRTAPGGAADALPPDADPLASRAGMLPALAPTAARQGQWLVLSAMGSVMLLAVTNHVTQNISSVPFLWVLPLSLYLISFILCFDHPRWYQRWVFMPALLVGIPAMASQIASLKLSTAAPLYFAGLFAACMFCHGELARLKPDPRYLTRFYLMLSLGGAVGAVLVAIVAPLTLDGYFELNIVLVALALLLLARLPGAGRLLGLLAAGITAWQAWSGAHEYAQDLRAMQRDFYGVVRVRDKAEPVPYRALYHGAIIHGGQLLGAQYRNVASDYFGPTSGYGRLFAALQDLKPGPRRLGVIGLGAGVIAAYGRAGDTLTFYEISQRVVDIEKREFTYLQDTGARVDIRMGDGRLSLERELAATGPRGFDVLGIDAFAGDSIPMHLITREAMQLYARHIADDGVIVFQATNRYVDLMPVIKRLATEVGLQAVLVSDTPDKTAGADYWRSSTDQVLVTRNAKLLAHAQLSGVAQPVVDRPGLPTFTDAHHNLIRILK